MTLPLLLAARRRRWAPRPAGAHGCRSRLWLALAVLLVACGQAAAAAPLQPVTSAPADGKASVLLATASATARQQRTAAALTVTPIPSAVPNTATVAPSQVRSAPIASPSAALPATATPTAELKAQPTLGAFSITPLADATLVTPNPTAVLAQTVAPAIVNVLLIGTDSRPTDPTFRTDTLIVVSINKDAGTVSLLSIPRDLFVYIPTYGMARINLAFQAAGTVAFKGDGPALLEQTILYNLGIPIQYYALVDFGGFRQVVDTLGGIDVPVNCQVTEYKLKDPTLDERVVSNYSLYTQTIGLTHMDGALALWYARARPVGGDFFRGYRQRQVLSALFHKGLNANILPDIPNLYANFRDVVQTDMGLWDVMQFVPMAARLDDSNIRSFNIGPNQSSGWTTPAGEDVLIPNPAAIALVVKDFLAGTTANQIAKPLTWVQVSNGSAKGSPIKRLQSVMHVADEHVMSEPDPNSAFQFQVTLGLDYNSCPRLDWMDTTTTGSVK